MATPTPEPDDLRALTDLLRGIIGRLETLERPTGTQTGSLVAQVQAALANINAQVASAIAANSYTKSQIDSKIASPGAITPTDVTASGTGRFDTGLRSSGAYNTDVSAMSGARQTVWQHNSGVYGYAASSQTKKTNLQPLPFTAADVLAVQGWLFQYKSQLAIRDDPTNPEYDPTYPVPWDVGLMAEHLIAHRMSCFVFFDDDGNPKGINYDLFGALAPLVVVADLQAQITDLNSRLVSVNVKKGI